MNGSKGGSGMAEEGEGERLKQSEAAMMAEVPFA